MPVFNGAEFVRESIESVLSQTYEDLELLVVDDCSTDNTVELVRDISDPRLRLMEMEKNGGPSAAMNAAIRDSRGEYIARIDGDDLAYPDRISEQLRYMDRFSEVGICAAFAHIIGDNPGTWLSPSDPEVLRATLTYYNPICHSTVMLRRTAIESFAEPYDPARRHGEDYDVYLRVSRNKRIACIPKFLAAYRRHKSQVSGNKDYATLGELDPLFSYVLEWLGVVPTERELRLHRTLGGWVRIGVRDLSEIEAWIVKLGKANEKSGAHDARAFWAASANRFYDACLRCEDRRRGISLGLRSTVIRREAKLTARLALRALGALRPTTSGAAA